MKRRQTSTPKWPIVNNRAPKLYIIIILVNLNGRNAAEGKEDVQLCLWCFNDGSCVELKGDFNRS